MMYNNKENGHKDDEQAMLRLVNLLYDTDETHLPELTRIERRSVLPLSIMMMKQAALDPNRKDANGRKIPLSRVWMNAYFRLQRSVDRWYFMVGAGIAHEQTQAEEEPTTMRDF